MRGKLNGWRDEEGSENMKEVGVFTIMHRLLHRRSKEAGTQKKTSEVKEKVEKKKNRSSSAVPTTTTRRQR